jgi:energy-coupling factor transport system permease protein
MERAVTRIANPAPWILWGLVVTLSTVATRNPLYLSMVLAAVTIVHLSRPRDGEYHTVWSVVIRIGVLVAVMTITFNLLTVHAGDRILAQIPGRIPIIGGAITMNALFYGVSSALAILSLIIAASTFALVVDRAALLRIVPQPISSIGVAAVVGLSFFPQTLLSLRQVREAQSARGFRIRSVRDVRPLVVPVLSLGLEGAFNLAESMESRAFGGSSSPDRSRRWTFPAGVVLTIVAISLLIGGRIVLAAFAAATGVALVVFGLLGAASGRTSFRRTVWNGRDWLIAGLALVSIAAFVIAILFFPSEVEWSPFPTLVVPPFDPWLGVACLLLTAPALLPEWVR